MNAMSDVIKDVTPALIAYETKMGKLDGLPMLEMTTTAMPAAKGPAGAMRCNALFLSEDHRLLAEHLRRVAVPDAVLLLLGELQVVEDLDEAVDVLLDLLDAAVRAPHQL